MPRAKSIVMDETKETNEATTSTVTIEKSELNAILKRIEGLEKKRNAPSVTTEKKLYTGPRNYHVRTIDGKVITKFEMIKNSVRKNAMGGWDEDQRCRLTYADGTTEDMLFFDYTQEYNLEEAITPLDIVTEVKVTFVDPDTVSDPQNRKADPYREPEMMSEAEFNKKYKNAKVEGVHDYVINHDVVLKADYFTSYYFQEAKLNNGEQFIVEQSAIN